MHCTLLYTRKGQGVWKKVCVCSVLARSFLHTHTQNTPLLRSLSLSFSHSPSWLFLDFFLSVRRPALDKKENGRRLLNGGAPLFMYCVLFSLLYFFSFALFPTNVCCSTQTSRRPAQYMDAAQQQQQQQWDRVALCSLFIHRQKKERKLRTQW